MSNDDESDLSVALPAAAAALSAEERAGLVNELKNKLQTLAGQHADVLETLSPHVRKRVEVLREIQSEHDALEKKFFEERAALEAKYQKHYEPLYTKRYEIVNGIAKVEGETNEAMIDKEGDGCVEEKGVPDFWLTAMKTNEVLAEEITERDEGALKYLKDIKWGRRDDPKGFKLEFFFYSNPYFKNSVLTKTYHMVDDENEPILEKALGTKIEWCPGKCLTQKVLKKKPKKGSKNAKPITKTENCESFFNFFNPPQIPDDDGDIDDELAEELQDRMEHDYNIGSEIRDKLIPHAVSWFTGEAVQGNEYDALEGDFDSDDEDDDEDEDVGEDRDEEDEGEDNKGKKKSGSANAGQSQRSRERKQQ
ncbi:nucleosome assembly protein 1;4-like [Hibiscus syriacus]|nr:nucleosome assembly protein 1;4-like [Hibiscus syriacus]